MSQIHASGSISPSRTVGLGTSNATLKGKINGLEETVRVLTDEVEFYANEICSLREEKEELERNLAAKTQEIRNTMLNEVEQSNGNLKQNFQQLKAENLKAQGEVSNLKTAKTALNQHLLDLKRRAAELELMIGDDN
jgi:chromosome segregation ATPase